METEGTLFKVPPSTSTFWYESLNDRQHGAKIRMLIGALHFFPSPIELYPDQINCLWPKKKYGKRI